MLGSKVSYFFVGISMARGSEMKPKKGLRVAFYDTLSVAMHHGEAVLRLRMILPGREAISHGKRVLRLGISLHGRLAELFGGGGIVLGQCNPLKMEETHVVLRHSIAFIGQGADQFKCGVIISSIKSILSFQQLPGPDIATETHLHGHDHQNGKIVLTKTHMC